MGRSENVRRITEWDTVAPLVAEVRDACTRLRWHQALRRRIPEASLESRVRGAAASAVLDGARTEPATIRRVLCGDLDLGAERDPSQAVVTGAVQVVVEAEHTARLVRRAPAQVLSRLHVAAAAPLSPPDEVGRPRQGQESCGELVSVGAPLPAEQIPARLHELCALMTDPSAPAYVVAALVHAELAVIRPFVRGNGLVARAAERAYLVDSGLDPTGVAVPEVGHASAGQHAYLTALAAYATGTREGLEHWLTQWGRAMLEAVAEGHRIADAVLVGKLSGTDRSAQTPV